VIVFLDGVRDGAIGGDDQVIVAHVGVVGAEEDADVAAMPVKMSVRAPR
jgi:hypothetical protein